ncbi:YrdB family protein [Spirosoma aerophilum]
MLVIKTAHQLVAFLLEIAMLIVIGMWGFQLRQSTIEKYLIGIGLPLLAACLWGLWAAPRSAYRLELPYRVLFSSTLFGVAAFLLHRLGHTTLGILFALIAVVSAILELIFER